MYSSETTIETASHVRRTLAGDRAAFDELVRRHAGMVHIIALTRLGHDADAADELTQEVFLRAWLHLDKLSNPEMFAPWLARIARNLAADWRRRDRRNSGLVQMVPLDAAENMAISDAAADPHRTAAKSEDAAQIMAALQKLSEEQQELLMLHHAEGLSQSDIARRLGVHRATIMRKLDRATQRLRALYHTNAEATLHANRPDSSKAAQRTLAVLAAAWALPAATRASLAEMAVASLAIPAAGTTLRITAIWKRVAIGAVVVAVVVLGFNMSGAFDGVRYNGVATDDGSASSSRATIRLMDEGAAATDGQRVPGVAQGGRVVDRGLTSAPTGHDAITTRGTQSRKALTPNMTTTGAATFSSETSQIGWVTGQVLNSSGQPMTNITVEFSAFTFGDDTTLPTGLTNAVLTGIRHPTQQRGRKDTDAQGRFHIDLKSTGTAVLYTDIEPYIRTMQKVEIPADGVEIKLTTVGDARAKGKVLRLDTGEPVPDASLGFLMEEPVQYWSGDRIGTQTLPLRVDELQTITDSNGQYSIDRMPPIPLQIRAWTESEPGIPPDILSPDTPVLVSGSETILPDLFVFPGYTVRGYVRDKQTSAPIAGAVIGMISGPPNAMGRGKMRAETNEQGYYELAGHPPMLEHAGTAATEKRERGINLISLNASKDGFAKAYYTPFLAKFDPENLVVDYDFELQLPSANPRTGPMSKEQRIEEHAGRIDELIRLNSEKRNQSR